MRIDTDEQGNIKLTEVYSGILLETVEGNQIGICMRDDTIEINVCPKGEDTKNWWRVNMQDGTIERTTPPFVDKSDGDLRMHAGEIVMV